MECLYWWFFILHLIHTFLPLVSSRPSVLAKTKVFNLHSADFPRAIKSSLSNFPGKELHLYLPSHDSFVTRRSSDVGASNTIRFGRSVDEEQVYNDDAEIDSNASYDVVKSTKTDNKDNNILCVYPREDDSDHLLCTSPRNVTSQFYAIAEPPSEDETDTTTKPNHTEVLLRSVRAVEGGGENRVRKSKGGSFLRFGKAMTFNRFDRGRDNFMRFGRSNLKKKSWADNSIRFGRRALRDEYDRSLRGNSFMRLGRNTYVICDSDECLNRNIRNSDGFLRYGRPSNGLAQQERAGDTTLIDRDTRSSDAFMRYGRPSGDTTFTDRDARSSAAFLRYGRPSSVVLALQEPVGGTTLSDQDTRSSDAFLRYGRPSSGMLAQEGQIGGITLSDRDGEVDDVAAEWGENDSKRSGYNSLLRPGQRSRNFLRLGRAATKECAEDDEHCVNDNPRFKRSSADDVTKRKTCLEPALPGEHKDNDELAYSGFRLRTVKNKSNDRACEEGGRLAGKECENYTRSTDEVPFSSPTPIDKNS